MPELRSQFKTYEGLSAPRSLLHGIGLTDRDLEKPRIGVINTWSDINPGHIHLLPVAKAACEGVREAGGMPFNFNGMNLCDCIGSGPYVLPSRDLLVNEIEMYAEANKLDGLVLIGTCDKVVPALLMAAGRLDLPTIIVTGGYMNTGKLNGQNVDFIDIGVHLTKLREGKITQAYMDQLIDAACPAPGACGMMGTANSMSLMVETIGMSLPGNATTSARSDRLLELAEQAGRQVVRLWENGITARKIITEASVTNAIKVCMAVGGSANTVIHIPAAATEAELELDCSEVYAQASQEIPLLVGIRPNGPHTMRDFDEAGGLHALLAELQDQLDLNCLCVNGKTLGENINRAENRAPQVIHHRDDPLDTEGGLILVKGNIAPEGAFIKKSAVPRELWRFRGKARVFFSVMEAIEALEHDEIQENTAVFVLMQGPKGGPGSAYQFATRLKGSKLGNSCCTITDGRLSGAAAGACFGYLSPEAGLRGPVLAVRDGDIVEYDIEQRFLRVELPDEEIRRRVEAFDLKIDIPKGFMGIYKQTVGSILKGAVMSGKNVIK